LHDPDALKRACEFARKMDAENTATEHVWSARTSSFLTGLAMADILADLRLDQESLLRPCSTGAVREGKTTQAIVKKNLALISPC
jgi:GTP pyrophosphokinase